MILFGKKRFYQAIFLSLSISAIPIVFLLETGPNHGKMPTGLFLLFLVSLVAFYSLISVGVYVVIGGIFSSRYKNRYLSEKDISGLDDEGKAIVRDFLKRYGEPITERRYDSIRKSIISEKKEGAELANTKKKMAKALSLQKKAIEQ